MPRIVYVNGRYLPYGQAAVHVEDRGLQFADSVYEVVAIRDGAFYDERRHLDRLERSLGELAIRLPIARSALQLVMREVVAAERVANGHVYIQVTRGVAPRDHGFPAPGTRPGLVVMARRGNPAKRAAAQANGVAVITVPETRWARVDIKTTALIANVLAKQAAREQGAYEAWFVDAGGYVTEGSSSNAWIVDAGGRIVTRAADHAILRGITREVTGIAAKDSGYSVDERKFTLAEAVSATEAFLTSATNEIIPITRIDHHVVGNGAVGPVAKSLLQCFYDAAETGPTQ